MLFRRNFEGYTHSYQFTHFSNEGIVITDISQNNTDSDDINLKTIFTPLIDFNSMNDAIRYQGYTDNSTIMYIISGSKDDIIKIDLETLSVSYLVQNENYQFTGILEQLDGTLVFWGFSLSSSEKVLGQIDENGVISILENIPSETTIYKAFKAGSISQ